MSSNTPLVSVIIPCFNHGRYLNDSVASVKAQTYPAVEVIVVDDGSTDDTEVICQKLDVAYVHQSNQGLSAARNTGIEKSTGEFLVFLDADDWLYPDAISINVKYLTAHPECVFASGWHDKVDNQKHKIVQDEQVVINENHFIHFLQGNYIGMHAAVMYRRQIFKEFKYDTTLKACEDYDLYLRISKKNPVCSHNGKIAAYRIHGENMSSNIPFMLNNALKVLKSKKDLIETPKEKKALANGIKIWKTYYAAQYYQMLKKQLSTMQKTNVVADEKFLAEHSLKHYLKFQQLKLKKQLKKLLPEGTMKYLFKNGYYKNYVPSTGKIDSGDFERSTPFSTNFGYDRGGPVDRYYIESFLKKNKSTIKGRVLEIGDNAYTLQFGGSQVAKSDVLHVHHANDTVTFVGDLTDAPQIPDNTFDCIILTQTLHLIYDFKAALRTCYRILKPGGSLLLTVPGISHIDHGEWKENWLWSFTAKAMEKIFAETFSNSVIEINTYGNVYIATTFLYGMGLPEVNHKLLDMHDPSYQVIVSAKATK